MFHLLEVSKRAMALTFQQECLAIAPTDNQDKAELFPLNELSAVLISEPAISISGILPAELSKNNIPMIVCDKHRKNYTPFLNKKIAIS